VVKLRAAAAEGVARQRRASLRSSRRINAIIKLTQFSCSRARRRKNCAPRFTAAERGLVSNFGYLHAPPGEIYGRKASRFARRKPRAITLWIRRKGVWAGGLFVCVCECRRVIAAAARHHRRLIIIILC
jgi:hypothetical protein